MPSKTVIKQFDRVWIENNGDVAYVDLSISKWEEGNGEPLFSMVLKAVGMKTKFFDLPLKNPEALAKIGKVMIDLAQGKTNEVQS